MISLIAKRFLFTNQFSSHRSFLCWHRAEGTSPAGNQSVGVFPIWLSAQPVLSLSVFVMVKLSVMCGMMMCVRVVLCLDWLTVLPLCSRSSDVTRSVVSPSHPATASQPPATLLGVSRTLALTGTVGSHTSTQHQHCHHTHRPSISLISLRIKGSTSVRNFLPPALPAWPGLEVVRRQHCRPQFPGLPELGK